MIFNIPTSLTLFRIFLIPVFVVVFYLPYGWSALVCTSLFVLAAFTDWLDGYLARRLNQASGFGAFLDPVADKLMVAAALIILVGRNPTSFDSSWLALPTVVIIGREIAISALREWMAEIGERAMVAVSSIGKIKTTAQMTALVFMLYREPAIADIGLGLLYVAACLTLWSMIIYIRAAWPVLTGKKNRRVS